MVQVITIPHPHAHTGETQYQVQTTEMFECNRLDMMFENFFGKEWSNCHCPLCLADGFIGTLAGYTTFASEAIDFGGDDIRTCPLCQGTGKLIRSKLTLQYHRVRFTDDAPADIKLKGLHRASKKRLERKAKRQQENNRPNP